jgi:hypothetical protein
MLLRVLMLAHRGCEDLNTVLWADRRKANLNYRPP